MNMNINIREKKLKKLTKIQKEYKKLNGILLTKKVIKKIKKLDNQYIKIMKILGGNEIFL